MHFRFFGLVLLICIRASGQTVPDQAFSIRFTKDSLVAEPGTTVSTRLLIRNISDRSLTLPAQWVYSPDCKNISTLPTQITLAPGAETGFPVKFLLSQNPHSGQQLITVRITTSSGTVQSTLRIRLSDPNPAWLLSTDQDQPSFLNPTEGLRLSVRIRNQTFRARNVRFELGSYPAGFDLPAAREKLLIPARTDTTITVSCVTNRYVNTQANYLLTLTVKDSTGDHIGSLLFKPFFQTSERRFTSADPGRNLFPNAIQAGFARLGSGITNREIRLWGQETSENGSLRYQAQYLNITPGPRNELRDAFVELQKKSTTIRAGNLYDYQELALLGRGLHIGKGLPAGKLDFRVLDNNWNLLHSFRDTTNVTTYSLQWQGYAGKNKRLLLGLSPNYQTGHRFQNGLIYTTATYQPNSRHFFSLVLGGSKTWSADRRYARDGQAAGLSYTFDIPALEFRNRLYFSTPGYAGFQKGARNIDSWLVARKSFRNRYALHLNTFRYEDARQPDLPRYGMTIAEGIYTRTSGRWVFTLKPYYFGQVGGDTVARRSDAYRLASSVAYQAKQTRIEAGYDPGRTFGVDPVFSQRFNLILSSPVFGLYALYQRGPYFLTDVAEHPSDFRLFSTTPSVHFNGKTFKGYVGVNATFDTRAGGWTTQLVGQMTVRITDDVFLLGEAAAFSRDATLFRQPETIVTTGPQYRLSVQKRLRSFRKPPGRTLRLRFFEDLNLNGLPDTDEPGLPRLVVRINGSTLVTDEKGAIVFKGLPEDTYEIQAYGTFQSGNPAMYTERISLTRSVSREIPLKRTVRVSGVLRAPEQKYLQQKVDFSQFKLVASDAAGVGYPGYPDRDGHFCLFLPAGNYRVDILDLRRPAAEAVVYSAPLTVESRKEPGSFDILLEHLHRSVEVRRLQSRL